MNGKRTMKMIQTAFFPPERSSRRITSLMMTMKIQIARIQKKNRIEYQKTSRNVVSANTICLLSSAAPRGRAADTEIVSRRARRHHPEVGFHPGELRPRVR